MDAARRGMWKILTSLAIGVLLLSPNATGAADFPSARGTIRLEYERGLLSAEIAQAPLADVLAALRQLSGLRVRTLGGLPTDSPVSTTVHAAPLVEGVRKILGDRSYVLQVDGDELSVQLLLGPETDHGASSPAAPAGAAERHGPRPVSSAPDALAPLAWQDPADRAEDIAQTGDGARTRQAEGQVEARLTRALAALRSDQARGHGEALDQLAYSTDARAIEVLKEVALGTLEVAPAVRVHAVAALARHALQRTSSDSTLLPVLEQLADNGDAAVSAVARQTLEDLWRQEP